MNLLDFSIKTGWPASASTWQFMQEQMLQLQLLSLLGGNNYIVSGCIVTGSNVSNGVVVINGEVMPLVGGSVQPTVTVNEVGTSRAFKDGVPRGYYKNRFASFGLGTTNYTWADFERNDPSNGVLKRLRLAEQLLTSVGSAITGINTALTTKANTADVLTKTNTSVYAPTNDYHPATKAYVDANSILLKGTLDVGDVASAQNEMTVSLGVTLPDANYMVIATLAEKDTSVPHWYNPGVIFCIHTKTTTSFKVQLREIESRQQSLVLDWILIKK